MRARRFGPKLRYRVDLHGVSVYGPGEERTILRWEWVEAITAGPGGVVVQASSDSVTLPDGAFGLASADLAARLESARSITSRPEVIGRLSGP